MSVEPVFHAKTEFFSPFKTNPLSNSLDIENFQGLGSIGKSKENTGNFANQNNNFGLNNNNNQMGDHNQNNNEDVLTTVTNFSLGSNVKPQNSYETVNNKKENEKKKWMKRI